LIVLWIGGSKLDCAQGNGGGSINMRSSTALARHRQLRTWQSVAAHA
jgi:hypothetical protein